MLLYDLMGGLPTAQEVADDLEPVMFTRGMTNSEFSDRFTYCADVVNRDGVDVGRVVDAERGRNMDVVHVSTLAGLLSFTDDGEGALLVSVTQGTVLCPVVEELSGVVPGPLASALSGCVVQDPAGVDRLVIPAGTGDSSGWSWNAVKGAALERNPELQDQMCDGPVFGAGRFNYAGVYILGCFADTGVGFVVTTDGSGGNASVLPGSVDSGNLHLQPVVERTSSGLVLHPVDGTRVFQVTDVWDGVWHSQSVPAELLS